MSAADEAREKLEGVTPGPWRTFHDDAEDYLRVVRPTPIGTTGKYTAMRDITPDIEVDADAEFLAWCREGVPRLLAELAKAQARADELQTFARGQEIVRAALESDLQTLEEIRALHNADGKRWVGLPHPSTGKKPSTTSPA